MTGLGEIRIEALRADSSAAEVEAARGLLLEYGRCMLEVEGPARFCYSGVEDEMRGLPGSYAAPAGDGLLPGAFLVARVEGAAAGCVGYRALATAPEACVMKRLWVRPEFRSLGLGERLAQEVLTRAEAAGFREVFLDTVPETMGSAYRMYLRMGFMERAPFHRSATTGMVFLRYELRAEKLSG